MRRVRLTSASGSLSVNANKRVSDVSRKAFGLLTRRGSTLREGTQRKANVRVVSGVGIYESAVRTTLQKYGVPTRGEEYIKALRGLYNTPTDKLESLSVGKLMSHTNRIVRKQLGMSVG